MASLALVFDLLARDRASSEFRKVGESAERSGKQVDRSASLMAGSLKAAGGLLAGLGIGSVFTGFVKDAAEAARIGRLTDQVIASTGGAANITAKQVESLATSISNKTAVDDEQIQSASNLLLTFTKVRNEVGEGNDIFNQATQAAIDMSVALGTDANGAAIQLGKALNDPIKGVTALSRAGVSFTQQQRDQIKVMVEAGDTLGAQKIILAEMQTQFGGAAAAAADPLQRLATVAGNLGEEVGAFLLPAIEGFSNILVDGVIPAVRTFADFVGDIPGPVKAGAAALGAFVLLRGPLTNAFETIALKALYARDSIRQAGGAVGGFKTAAGGLVGFLGGPWGLAIGAAVTGIGFLASGNDDAAEAEERHKGAAQNLASALRESNGVITDNIRLERIREAQQEGLIDIAERAGVSQRDIAGAIEGNSSATARLVEGLRAYADAQTTVQDTGTEAKIVVNEQGKAALDAAGRWQGFAGQVDAGRAALEQQRGVMEASTGATDDLGTAAGEAAEEVKELKDRLDDLTGVTVNAIEAESRYQEAVDSAKGALDDLSGSVVNNRGKINLQSEAGRAAADVLLDMRGSGNELIDALRRQGATSDDVRRRDAQLRRSFIDTAREMGIGQKQAEELARDILGIPKERRTEISADTGAANRAIDGVQANIAATTGKTVTIQVRAAGRFVINPQGGLQEFGDGPGFDRSALAAAVPTIRRSSLAGARRAGDGPGRPAVLDLVHDTRSIEATMADFAKDISEATPAGAPLGAAVGYQAMFAAVRRAFPSVALHSGFRPGSITATGNLSYHALGRAVDITPSMAVFEWLRQNYPGSRELIFSPAGGRQIWNGRPHYYGEPTRGDHWDHIHWAMKNGGVIGEPVFGIGARSGQSYLFGEAGPETVTPGLPGSGGPVDLSDDTISRLAVATGRVMRDGAESVTAQAFRSYDQRKRYSRG